MTRMMLMTFFTDKRWEKGRTRTSRPPSTGPLVVPAALAVFGGLLILNDWIVDWLSPVTGTAPLREPADPGARDLGDRLRAGPGRRGGGVAGRRSAGGPRTAPTQVSWVTRAGREEVYGNVINDTLVVDPGGTLAGVLATDRYVVDGRHRGPVAIGAVAGVGGAQNGFVRSYALSLPRRRAHRRPGLLAVNPHEFFPGSPSSGRSCCGCALVAFLPKARGEVLPARWPWLSRS